MVYKVVKGQDESGDLAKHHKRVLKYVKQDVSSVRASLFAKAASSKLSTEKKLLAE